ncbi:DEAD/DEAH box helicase [Tuwongella immobilis]|uniref:Uncharacterized protein n=1 Tax=Tuwongella immobilis TaxID=692036 RepID=A0A6C2YIK4_9BACT|nr:DEAD/DEAH box helicase [Tuwongella immobilis]VIP01360.1 helicase snf2 : DNA/RNA helicase, SNF2 family OS=Leptospirillum ferrodiazotrophum GN=UBAL3_74420081 PE=4 SV=1: SNF2_N: Helicase_C [Tuwongella immobilis]VTR98173.1 helicase snf2 : DNA/RNA helicase, SNF2 family OS=Leptospirillum ferrodiazotrophum GN=UBAL3_74420081 PE=4 SV=1: SNF2_N: Helicase_C [Tuwongella immobilis]
MLRDEQIDIRKRRGRQGKFAIENIGKNRFLSTFTVTNTENSNQYTVQFRCFTDGENTCTCPDFRTNTLRTCKHIEAVKAHLEADSPPTVRQRRFSVKDPEIALDYGERLCLVIHLPERNSDRLTRLASQFFDREGLWKDDADFEALREAADDVPERILFTPEAEDFIDLQLDRRKLRQRERELIVAYESGDWIPDLLSVPLYDYQVRGAIFLACRGRSILADDMGLGKTVQTLAAVELLARERAIQRVLVVTPASVKYQWEGEIRKFTQRSVQVIDGRNYQREDQYRESAFYRLVNYEQVIRDLPQLNAWQPDLVVIDEAQRIKNWESETSRAVKRLRSRFAIVLTGTPLENRLEELYSIVQFVDDRLLGPAFQFLNDHRVLDDQGRIVQYRRLDAIRQKIEPICLRRTRNEVLTELPERIDSRIYVELSPDQKSIYDAEKAILARLLRQANLGDADRRRVLASITKLRLVCNSAALADGPAGDSPKLEEFEECIREAIREDGRKMVVFSQWESMIRLAAEVLDRTGVGYVVLHGKVPIPDRPELMERFCNHPDCRVFLSTDAGGVGLNLQAADTVINLELPWNPAVLDQRVARVHRMGQRNPVRVIHLLSRGTIEERVLAIQERKRLLFQGLFDSDSLEEISVSAFRQPALLEQLQELLVEDAPIDAGSAPPERGTSERSPSTQNPPQPHANARVTAKSTLASAADAVAGVDSAAVAMWAAGVPMLEAMAAWAAAHPHAVPTDWAERARQAAARLAAALESSGD